MIDPKFVRENPTKIKEILSNGRGDSSKVDVDKWLELDKERKDLSFEREQLNQERNMIAQLGKSDPDAARAKGKELKERINNIEKVLADINHEWQKILDWMPNIPYDEVPLGKSEEDNVELKAWTPRDGYLDQSYLGKGSTSGEKMSSFGSNADSEFMPKPHWEIGVNLGIIDFEAGAKVSGSRFYYIKKEGALLIKGVFNLLTKKLLQEGFDPMIVPILVKGRALYGSGHFPGDEDQVYKLESKYLEDQNGLYLLGSSEPSNFGYFMDKTLDSLPVKVMAETPCFRSEVGSWGKDVRGIKRTHQFDKLEMNMIIEADDEKAREMQEYLLSINEWLLQELEIPYHVINMCYGELGYFAAAKKYDVEVWLPSEGKYMEVMSDSITTDFQSRRLNIKYKDQSGELKYPYTLNDTGATHRILIAIIEHYQQSDGSIKVPEVLRDYVGKESFGK
jgi:seryl-tRNA synthetase